MPVYRAEVSWTGTAQANANASFFLSAADDNETWAIEGRREVGVGAAQFVFTFNASPDPGLGTLISGTSTLTGADFSTYDSGGTVAIEKDTTAGTITFVSPLGNETRNLSAFGADDDSRLRPVTHALQITRLTPLTQDSSAQVKFLDFYGKKDGVSFLGAALSDVDPGAWSAFSFANFGTPANPTIPQDNAQEPASYRMRFVYVNATDSPKSPGSREWRTWAGGDNIGFNPFGLALDAACCPTSGFLYVLRINSVAPTEIRFAHSQDQGATWSEQVLHTLGGAVLVWPTLACDPRGRILASWQDKNDMTQQYWAISENYGRTWSSVSTGTYSPAGSKASVHRLRFHPGTGLLCYLFRDVLDPKMKALVFDEYGLAGFTAADPWITPAIVADPATSDHWPALTPNANGEWIADWCEGDRVPRRSDTHGRYWLQLGFESATVKAQIATWYDPPSGLHYAVYQDPASGDLIAYTSDSNGLNSIAGGPTGTVITGREQQYHGVVTDHRGHVYVLYQELSAGAYVLKCRRSDSYGKNWVTA